MPLEWELEEFETLLQNPPLANAKVGHLVNRSPGAIVLVRQGIHAYHRAGDDTSMLSSMMLRRLAKGGFTCPLCNGSF